MTPKKSLWRQKQIVPNNIDKVDSGATVTNDAWDLVANYSNGQVTTL